MAKDETMLDEVLLHRLADGELDVAELAELEATLGDADRARIDGLHRVGDLVRLGAYEAAESLDSRKLFADIEAGIAAQEEAGFGDAFRVIEGGGGAVAQPSARPSLASDDSQVRPEGWKIVVPVAAGLLAAAVVMLVVLSGNREKTEQPAEHAQAPVQTVIETPAGNEVLDVDLGQNAGTVFAVQGDTGEPLAVIWIEDDFGQPPVEKGQQGDNALPVKKEGSSI